MNSEEKAFWETKKRRMGISLSCQERDEIRLVKKGFRKQWFPVIEDFAIKIKIAAKSRRNCQIVCEIHTHVITTVPPRSVWWKETDGRVTTKCEFCPSVWSTHIGSTYERERKEKYSKHPLFPYGRTDIWYTTTVDINILLDIETKRKTPFDPNPPRRFPLYGKEKNFRVGFEKKGNNKRWKGKAAVSFLLFLVGK